MASSSRKYRIRVGGVASDLVRAAFEDVTVTEASGQTELLTGDLDTAALYGLISRIEELGLVLLDVRVLDDDTADPPARSRAGGMSTVGDLHE